MTQAHSATVTSKGQLCQMDSKDFKANLLLSEKAVERNRYSRYSYYGQDEGLKEYTSFANPPGKMSIGLCWWHSRLQRSASYLAVFNDPAGDKPSDKEKLKILKKLRDNKSVVEISGYKNWFEFTKDNHKMIDTFLSDWQITDTLKFKFLNGLRAPRHQSPENFAKTMDEIYQEVMVYDRVLYTMISIWGPMNHGWLVLNVEKTQNGYVLSVIDSNFVGQIKEIRWNRGEPNINAIYSDDMGISIQQQYDFRRIAKALRNYCGGETPFTQKEVDIKEGRI